jgi:hypothetical protein
VAVGYCHSVLLDASAVLAACLVLLPQAMSRKCFSAARAATRSSGVVFDHLLRHALQSQSGSEPKPTISMCASRTSFSASRASSIALAAARDCGEPRGKHPGITVAGSGLVFRVLFDIFVALNVIRCCEYKWPG